MEKIGKKITLENVSHDEQETHLDSIEAIKGNIRERNTEEQLQQDQKELHFEIEHGKHLAEQRKRELAEKIKEEIDFLAKENPIIEEGLLAGKEDHEITWEKKESEKTGFWNKIWNKFKKPTTTTLGALTVASGAAGATGDVNKIADKEFSDSVKNKIEKTFTDSTDIKKTKESSLEFSDKLRNDWNKYVDWLDNIGLKGAPELDKNDLGGAMLDRYKKEHPETSVSRETIDDIQREFARYRAWVLEEVKAGRANLTPGTTPESFMKKLSQIDGIAGQFTTSHKFPDQYLKTFYNDKLVEVKKIGFAQGKDDPKTVDYSDYATK